MLFRRVVDVYVLCTLLGPLTGTSHAQCPLPCEPVPQVMPYCEPLPLQAAPLGETAPPQEIAPQAEPATPAVSIHVRVPASGAAGQELEYRILVENTSQAAAHHVVVRDPLPANVQFVHARPEPSARQPELVWHLGTLEAGAKREIVLIVMPAAADEVHNCARVQFEHGECVKTKIARPALRLLKEGPAQAMLYDSLSYKITLTNTGEAELSNLLLTDVLHAGLEHASQKDRLTWFIGTLAPGQSQSVDYQVIARKTGKLCNKAVASAAGNFREEMESCVTVGEAKLTASMTGSKRRYVNMPASFQISVVNSGTMPLENVRVTNPVPPGMTFQSASGGGQLVGNEVQWSLGTMPPGADQKLDIVLSAQNTGNICNQATVSADRGLSEQVKFCTEFIGMPALSLVVEDTTDPVEMGGTTAYLITVHNQGTSEVTSVRIQANAPDQEQVTDASGDAKHRIDGRKVTFEPRTLRAGETIHYRVDVKALREGDVRFKVQLTADQLIAGPVEQQESTTIFAALSSSRRKAPKTEPTHRVRLGGQQ